MIPIALIQNSDGVAEIRGGDSAVCLKANPSLTGWPKRQDLAVFLEGRKQFHGHLENEA
jgi:hypothetical protein